jgi:hypothetical protein
MEMRWYLATMSDGLFIINRPPRPSTDDQVHDRDDGPDLVLNVSGVDPQLAREIVDAHNLSLAIAAPWPVEGLKPSRQAAIDDR